MREAAEARSASEPPVSTPDLSTSALVHELQVHQIELEMQNQELRRSEAALMESNDRYRNLYDYAYHFAPVGYFTLSDADRVLDLNLTAAGFLGEERKSVLGTPFPRFVSGSDADRSHKFARNLSTLGDASSIDVTMVRKEKPPFPARFDVRVEAGEGGNLVRRVVLTDRSGEASVRDDLQESRDRLSELLAESQDGYGEWTEGAGAVPHARVREILRIENLGLQVSAVDRADWTAWTERVHPGDQASVANAVADLLTGRDERRDIGLRSAVPDRTWNPMRARGHVVKRNDAGRAVRIVGTITDLADRAPQAGSASPEQSRALLAVTAIRNFPGGVVALFDGNLRYAFIDGTGGLDKPNRRSLISDVLLGDWGQDAAPKIETVLREALAGRTASIEVSIEGVTVDVCAGPVTETSPGGVSKGVATFRIRSPDAQRSAR